MANQVKIDRHGVESERDERDADNWWWLVVRNPAREIHLYEIGQAVTVQQYDDPDDPEKVTGSGEQALTDERLDIILAEQGGPARKDLVADDPAGWSLELAPGRPNAYLEPKAYDRNGDLLPIRAKAGVTVHLLPDAEPGTPAASKNEA